MLFFSMQYLFLTTNILKIYFHDQRSQPTRLKQVPQTKKGCHPQGDIDPRVRHKHLGWGWWSGTVCQLPHTRQSCQSTN